MRAIIIGAGRGARLMPHTADQPKCFAKVGGKRILDWSLEALEAAGVEQIVFIGGYKIDLVKIAYPHFSFCHNSDWPNNNILLSLMYAREYMSQGFICAYSDILYRPQIVADLLRSPHDITLGCDTAWRKRYEKRTEHPETDGEKVAALDGRVTAINRTMPSADAHGEYIGVARVTALGAKQLIEHFDRCAAQYAGNAFQGSKLFEKAYLIDHFQELLDHDIAIHTADTDGGYVEIDTDQDYQLVRNNWPPS